MISVPALLVGQVESVDSISNNFVPEDTVNIENLFKTPELNVEKMPEKVFPATSTIPMNIPEMKSSVLLMPPRYLGYEGIKNILRYTTPKYDTKTLNLNLNFPPPKSLLDVIDEDPLRALLMLMGMANNTVMGEDKMNQIRLKSMIQSRSWIPETAISGNGAVYYEIDTKRKKY
jgi:hypothetical protein